MYRYIVILLCVISAKCEDPEVEIPQGRLRGGTQTNRDGNTYYSFLNIPYAKPPIGELRFKAPQSADGWEGIRDATEDLPQCTQAGFGDSFAGQEDCLYLNIYTPEASLDNQRNKPVMVFFYGGAFVSGSAMQYLYGANLLLTKDIILVTANYRVGIFGFLSLDDADLGVTGNAGLKDQTLVLQWVQENIEYFGGDPNNVLIFGESAGAISVHYHILSSMSKGLFHKAISQSGSALFPTIITRNNAVLFAEALEIETENWTEMLTSLQNVSTGSLYTAQEILTLSNTYLTWPIVEIRSSEEAFIDEEPIDIIRSGSYNHVPYLAGFNDAEGLLLQSQSIQATGENLLITDFTDFIPADLQIPSGSEEEEILAQKIKTFYYGDLEPSRDNITAAVDLCTDYYFAFPAYRSIREHVKTSSQPIYAYYFTGDTKLNFAKLISESIASFPGAAHADELGYLFYTPLTPPDIEEGSVEYMLLTSMVDLWTNFAIYSNPTPDSSAGYKWESVLENQFNYLYIANEKIYETVNPRPENMQFWNEIYEEYYSQ